MGAEVGATTSTFPYSDNMRNYLHATGRGPVAQAADNAASQGFLQADEGAEYDEVIEIVRIKPSPDDVHCRILTLGNRADLFRTSLSWNLT